MSHVLNSAAKRIATEFCLHLRVNFFARLRAAYAAFLIRLGPDAIPNPVVRSVLFHDIRRVNGRRPGTESSPRDVENEKAFATLGDDAKEAINVFIDQEREGLAIFRGTLDWITNVSLQDESSPRMARRLIWTYRALRRLEEFHEFEELRRRAGALRLRVRLFTLFPQARIGMCHVLIDANTFLELGFGASLWGVESRTKEFQVRERKRYKRRSAKLARWRSVFKLAPFLKRGRRDRCFDFFVSTDGVAASLLFRRSKVRPERHRLGPMRADPVVTNNEKTRDVLRRARDASEEFDVERTRVIAIDPGRRDLVHAVERVRAPALPRAPPRAGGAGPRAPPRAGGAGPAPHRDPPPRSRRPVPALPAPGSAALRARFRRASAPVPPRSRRRFRRPVPPRSGRPAPPRSPRPAPPRRPRCRRRPPHASDALAGTAGRLAGRLPGGGDARAAAAPKTASPDVILRAEVNVGKQRGERRRRTSCTASRRRTTIARLDLICTSAKLGAGLKGSPPYSTSTANPKSRPRRRTPS